VIVGSNPGLGKPIFYFIFSKMRQKVKKFLSIKPERDENVLSFGCDFKRAARMQARTRSHISENFSTPFHTDIATLSHVRAH
jgi:hypothetical protein